MKYKKIFVISPPFYSHFNPLLVLAKSFQDHGAEVTVGCSIEFKDKILKENLNFYEIDINSNKNTGKGEHALQPDTERLRLEEFFESTKKGAAETLITQSRHRKADMLYNPQELIDKIKFIDDSMDVDLYVVDILSYSVTLSLYSLGLPFVTFCPPHPNTIPRDGRYFNVPKSWPEAITVEEEDLRMLKQVSTQTQREFTEVFNNIISENKSVKKISNAFSLVSEIAVIYNYFDFNNIEETDENPKELFIGNSFEAVALDEEWMKRIATNEKKIMISLGTFLSNRKDVLEKLILSARESHPDALLIVSAGSHAEELKKYSSHNTIIEGFIPQVALMQYVDTVLFHGGCNTLTEAMYHGKEMVILPFSSDQFNIAYDIEKHNLGRVLDPNNFSQVELAKALTELEETSKDNLRYWRNVSRERGADYAVKKILEIE
ncbi:glycosyltransferase [Planococcus sp. CP5-4]|uniref:glycosyltransferase n=1 Tax=unclassified Planococcus (in: firmicutes) TaxID=2662419 RepID=UPI001C215D31|nr:MULTISPECIES: glycosyltransferase [unclassified Planococcus (in: firmicutes)]MBU9673844.1 glycosyltransferase [Planococcus sp. CP5-4_YE]MBV0908972.1 glycosyltransferase [Planococcus sp. CP5-4_UN]MBW6064021.1 glycosyltransferase [Planococcus sp. CP5-4]